MFGKSNKILRSKLRKIDLESIQEGTLKFRYKGISCLKNPFDLALYSQLLFSLKPMTIIELGSASGGSASWFSDQTAALGLETSIFSLDITPPLDLKLDRVKFIQGDIDNLQDSELPEILNNCVRPLLVIEDGPHTYQSCKNAIEFFHPYLRRNEYLVIEDGIVFELGLDHYQDGPVRAITEHIAKHGSVCYVDRTYCDFFGQNFTWATNGYIKYV